MQTRHFVMGSALILGLLTVACSPGPADRPPTSAELAAMPDPCTLVTRQEIQAVLGDPAGQPDRASPDFEDTPEPHQHVCRYTAVFGGGDVQLVVFPDPVGARLRNLKLEIQSDAGGIESDSSGAADVATYPRGLGRNAVQILNQVYAHKGHYTMGTQVDAASTTQGCMACARKFGLQFARAAYRRL
jgi:hypothetical protein